jgi:hypothetical protein
VFGNPGSVIVRSGSRHLEINVVSDTKPIQASGEELERRDPHAAPHKRDRPTSVHDESAAQRRADQQSGIVFGEEGRPAAPDLEEQARDVILIVVDKQRPGEKGV